MASFYFSGMPALDLSSSARALSRSQITNPSTNSEVRSQRRNPADILSLLLLVGGDVIQQAIGQLSGDPYLPTPVVFSLGWVAYTFKALLLAAGDNRLLPAPDLESIIIDVSHGHMRQNQSWVLGPILRDYEIFWMPGAVRAELDSVLVRSNSPQAGLCVAVFKADPKRIAGRPAKDLLWASGYAVAVLQLVITAIPWIIWSAWEIFVITATVRR
jgi:hypothetical protein